MKNQACLFNIQKFSLHDGPGIRSVVFFKGCPLRCFWCANPESQSGKPEKMWDNQKKTDITVGNYYTVETIIEEILKDLPFYEESGGGVTLSGGEVLFQADFAITLLQKLKVLGIHTACETTGFGKEEDFRQLTAYTDILYFDLKHLSTEAHRAGTGVGNELILTNLRYALKHHSQVIVRVPIIPGFNDTLEEAQQFAEFFSDEKVHTVELLPFHQFGEKKYAYLHKNYQMQDIPQLHSEDLLPHQSLIEAKGVQCIIR